MWSNLKFTNFEIESLNKQVWNGEKFTSCVAHSISLQLDSKRIRLARFLVSMRIAFYTRDGVHTAWHSFRLCGHRVAWI